MGNFNGQLESKLKCYTYAFIKVFLIMNVLKISDILIEVVSANTL